MIRARIHENRLILTADNASRASLAIELRQRDYDRIEQEIQDDLHEAFEFFQPEWIGALTDAPILVPCDSIDYSDEALKAGHPALYPEARVFWFPNYMIQDPWEALARFGRVVFVEAGAP